MVINVARSVWETKVGPTKTPSSENAIPVIPLLKDVLESRRTRLKPKLEDYMFAGERRGAPLNFHNLREPNHQGRVKEVLGIKAG